MINWTPKNSYYAQLALKIAIAVVVAMILFKFFNINHGYWLAFTALVVVKPTLGGTIKRARERFIGTFIGAGAAVLFVWVVGTKGVIFYIALFLSVFFTTYFIIFPYILFASVMTFMVVMMFFMMSGAATTIAIDRFWQTALGVLLSVVIALVIWPNFAYKRMKQYLNILHDNTMGSIVALVECYCGKVDYDVVEEKEKILRESLARSRSLFAEARIELGGRSFAEGDCVNIVQVEKLLDLLSSMKVVVKKAKNYTFQSLIKDDLDEFVGLLEQDLSANELEEAFISLQTKIIGMVESGRVKDFSIEERMNASVFFKSLDDVKNNLLNIRGNK